ncbi:hypothetical protein PL11201_170042 [Planktothrix sp. PCC 11201]|uniref:hypothetical protein n=1 Tax=Planktothrix sp. PCC 11201 TaxID=1729650 RepID=UPI0009119C0A|nr:hypothetical protein [Planktothrix sp. PCC 11201]SKB11659.1 hypothetical protein PL11201_170042 [Planktothrix sp. PCC 11201]
MNKPIEKNIIQQQINEGKIRYTNVHRKTIEELLLIINLLAIQENKISTENVNLLYSGVRSLFKNHLLLAGFDQKKIDAISTKFNDSGPRSAPWKPNSSRIPGRPQDGQDGNRINRWELPKDHKFYATEIDAKLVGVKYFLQALSMEGAPLLPPNSIQNSFIWLLGHQVEPGQCLDPIQLEPISFSRFIKYPRSIESGHVIPLDRGGKHIPSNTFLMESQSNRIQNNLTLDELWVWIEKILRKHKPELFKE